MRAILTKLCSLVVPLGCYLLEFFGPACGTHLSTAGKNVTEVRIGRNRSYFRLCFSSVVILVDRFSRNFYSRYGTSLTSQGSFNGFFRFPFLGIHAKAAGGIMREIDFWPFFGHFLVHCWIIFSYNKEPQDILDKNCPKLHIEGYLLYLCKFWTPWVFCCVQEAQLLSEFCPLLKSSGGAEILSSTVDPR